MASITEVDVEAAWEGSFARSAALEITALSEGSSAIASEASEALSPFLTQRYPLVLKAHNCYSFQTLQMLPLKAHQGGGMGVLIMAAPSLEVLQPIAEPLTNYSGSPAYFAFASEADPCPLLHACVYEHVYV